MRYLILIYGDEAMMGAGNKELIEASMAQHDRFGRRVTELGGEILGGEALQLTSSAISIRGDLVTDGPFIESKEALGGYYLIEASDLDVALAIARECPQHGGGVEVRPIWETAEM